MPVHHSGYKIVNGKKFGSFQWGNSGKKYLYQVNNIKQREIAKKKATLQGKAIHATGWSE